MDLDRFDVDWIFLLECVLLVSRNKSELVDISVEFSQGELLRDPSHFVEERQVALFFWLQIVQRDTSKVRHDDVYPISVYGCSGAARGQRRIREKAKKLKKWRERIKLSQSEAAEYLKIPTKTLQNWEIGRTMPRGIALTTLLKIFERTR